MTTLEPAKLAESLRSLAICKDSDYEGGGCEGYDMIMQAADFIEKTVREHTTLIVERIEPESGDWNEPRRCYCKVCKKNVASAWYVFCPWCGRIVDGASIKTVIVKDQSHEQQE